MYEKRVASLSELIHVEIVSDAGAVAQTARLETLLAHVYEYLTQRVKQSDGLFDAEGNPEPVLKTLLAIENSLRRTYRELCLTPASRKAVKLDVKGLAEAFADAEMEDADEEG